MGLFRRNELSISLAHVFTLDFETTGVEAKTCDPVEVAIYNGSTNQFFQQLIKPPVHIPPETSAVHHITDDDVEFEASWSDVRAFLENWLRDRCETATPVIVAHNAEYEKGVLLRPGQTFIPLQWICTYKCALRIWPEAPSHKNEVLRYWLKLGTMRGRKADQAPHSAMHDVVVTYSILTKLLEHATMEQLIEWTEQPAKLPKMPMGKHFGQAWDTIPAPYLEWCLKQADMREDVKHAAKEELTRRRTNATGRSG